MSGKKAAVVQPPQVTPNNRPTQLPPAFTANTQLLLSRIPLPPNASISYRQFSVAPEALSPATLLEAARYRIVEEWTGENLFESFYPTVRLDSVEDIWVFAISSGKDNQLGRLLGFQPDGLIEQSRGTFAPNELYPCSTNCASLPSRCELCGTHSHGTQNAESGLPRKALRLPFALFLDAFRSRIIDCIASSRQGPSIRQVTKLKAGFVLDPSNSDNEWNIGWEREPQQRAVVHCQLQLSLSDSCILIHPVLKSTSLLSLPSFLAVGAPLVLLPYGTPAYHVCSYARPADHFVQAFRQSLLGLGVGDWEREGYLLCWIAVHDHAVEPTRRDPQRGVAVVWPRRLCLYPTTRNPLKNLPPSLIPLSPPPPIIPPLPRMQRRSMQTDVRGFKATVTGLEGDLFLGIGARMGGYLDAIVKERERQRELSKREKSLEDSISPSASSAPLSATHILSTPAAPLLDPPNIASNFPAPLSFPVGLHYPSPPEFSPHLNVAFSAKQAQPPSAPPLAAEDSLPQSRRGTAWGNFNTPPVPSGSGGTSTADNLENFALITEDDFSFFDGPGVGLAESHHETLNLISGFEEEQNSFSIPETGLVSEGWDLAHSPNDEDDDDTALFGTNYATPSASPRSQPDDAARVRGAIAPLPLSSPRPSPDPPPVLPIITPSHVPGRFGSLRFECSYEQTDGKYASGRGKFSLPSPKSDTGDGDKDGSLDVLTFKEQYDALTDPKREIVLILRRQTKGFRGDDMNLKMEVAGRVDFASRPGGGEDWVDSDVDMRSQSSDSETNVSISDTFGMEGARELYNAQGADVDIFDACSTRLSTPPPTHIPHGANILHTQFVPHRLLPLSTTNISETADHSPSDATQTAIPLSVPTPVSPTAALNGAADSSTLLASVVQVFVTEAVENSVWEEATRLLEGDEEAGAVQGVDVEDVVRLLEGMGCVQALTPISNFLESTYNPINRPPQTPLIEQLQPPVISVAQTGSVLQISTAALRFWKKLNLEPLSGPKDSTAFVLYDEATSKDAIVPWLRRVSSAYKTRGLGEHAPGNCGGFANGLVPLRWDAFRKTLSTLLCSLPANSRTILYVITPPWFCSMTSVPFRQLSAIIAGQTRLAGAERLTEECILFHFVPEYIITNRTFVGSTRSSLGIDTFVASVYSRLRNRVARTIARPLFKAVSDPEKSFVAAPVFTLARTESPKFSYTLSWPPIAPDTMDHHTLMHIGYQISEDGEWLFTASIDQRGEHHDARVWKLTPGESESIIVDHLLEFSARCLCQAKIAWRLVFMKGSFIGEAELRAWETGLQNCVALAKLALHVSVTSLKVDTHYAFNRGDTVAKPSNSSGALIADVSSATYLVTPAHPWLAVPTSFNQTSFDDDSLSFEDHQAVCSRLESPRIPQRTGLLFTVPNDTELSMRSQARSLSISSCQVYLLHTFATERCTLKATPDTLLKDLLVNFHELSVLTKERWKLPISTPLPFHIASTSLMCAIVDRHLKRSQ